MERSNFLAWFKCWFWQFLQLPDFYLLTYPGAFTLKVSIATALRLGYTNINNGSGISEQKQIN